MHAVLVNCQWQYISYIIIISSSSSSSTSSSLNSSGAWLVCAVMFFIDRLSAQVITKESTETCFSETVTDSVEKLSEVLSGNFWLI